MAGPAAIDKNQESMNRSPINVDSPTSQTIEYNIKIEFITSGLCDLATLTPKHVYARRSYHGPRNSTNPSGGFLNHREQTCPGFDHSTSDTT